jgi:hypothetical protein
MLNAEKVRALFEKLSTSERESEEYGLKEDFHTTKIDPLIRKFQGMALTQPAASETGRKCPCPGSAVMLSSTNFGIG